MRFLVAAFALALPLTAHAAEPAAPVASEVVHRGAPFALKDAPISLDDIAATPDAYANKTTMISGKVASVCKKKGCWLGLKGEKGAVARVTFKDYGFFAPMDSEGRPAIVEATVGVTKLDPKERAHLASDAGKKPEEIPEIELRLVANGLELGPLPSNR